MLWKKSKKPAADAVEPAEGAEPPKKRSKLLLALLGTIPLLAAGGGYAGWMFFAPGDDAHAAVAEHGEAHPAPDPEKLAAERRAIAAESSYTHAYAMSFLIREKCGGSRASALKAASDGEALADGLLVQLSWVAATRRAAALGEKSCGHLLAEIGRANEKALRIAEAKAAAEQKAAKGGH